MVFSSLIFLFAYLPLTLLCYYVVPRRWRNPVLLVLSLAFYGWGEPVYVLLMLLSISSAYLFGFIIDRNREQNPRRAKWALIASLAVSLSLLFFFKYYRFFADNLSLIPGIDLPKLPTLELPIGISFYTFQIMSYTVDVYRGDCGVQKNPISFGTYVTLFPQLIAGPIVRYRDIDEQLTGRRESIDRFSAGVERFCCGLAKKVLIGDMLAAGHEYFKCMISFESTTLGAWLTVILYTLHLYYDFSGYSDMAIGLGRMLGFEFPENFHYPYIAKSITEFWRRWHMTLSSWFREYVYIPLGGNRRGIGRQILNLFIVWLLTGLWHGASWNFVIWGLYFFVILVAEKLFLLKALDRTPAALRHIYTMLLVTVGFLIFSFTDAGQGITCLGAMLGVGCAGFTTPVVTYQCLRLLPLVLLASVGATPLPRLLWKSLMKRHERLLWIVPILCVALILLCTAYLVDSTFSPFAYTQF